MFDRTQQRCLIGSAAAHAALLAAILIASGLAARRLIQQEVPFLEMIPTDLNLTMGNQIGGGTPNPRPLAAQEGTPAPPKVESVKPEPLPAQPTVTPKVEPKRVEPVKKAEPPKPVEPVKKAEPEKTVEPAKPERKVEVSREARSTAKAQDLDPTRKAEKTDKAATAPTKIQVSKETRTRSTEDRQKALKAAQEAQEAREAAAAEAAAREQRYAAAQALASRVSGAAVGVSKNVGGATQIDMPGPGGVAYAPYLSWLQTYLYDQWRRPSTSSKGQDWVGMEVVIAKDGTVLSAVIKRSSGVRSFDASAEDVFRRNRKLRPLPDDFKEPRLVVPVKFVLEANGTP